MLQFDLDIGDQDTSGKTLPHLREMTFNMITGEATSRQVADTVCDFPRVPLDLVGEFRALCCCFFLLAHSHRQVSDREHFGKCLLHVPEGLHHVECKGSLLRKLKAFQRSQFGTGMRSS